ncbi:MAG: pantetheine-phosphate adenylyltransferase [Sporolactobacillus sp.]
MNKIAVYPGSFDPVTLGHLDIIRRSNVLFDHIVVAVLNNSKKHPLFSVDERKTMLEEATKDFKHVTIDSFDGLLVNYLKKTNISIIIRGLRAITDFEYELQIASVNKHLCHSAETCFIMSTNEFAFLSSSIVKEIAQNGGDVSSLVPNVTCHALQEKMFVC